MKIRSTILTLALTLFVGSVSALAQQDTVDIKGKRFIIHHVEKGETIYSLSRQYGVTSEELTEANRGLAHGLKSGQRLKVPVKDAQTSQEQTPTTKATDTDVTTGATTVNSDVTSSSVDTNNAVVDQTATPSTETVATAAVDSVAAKPLFRKLQKGDVAEVMMMLPMGTPEQPNKNYVDFYRGFLIGLDSVRMSGYSVNLNFYNSGRSYEEAMAIVESGALDKANLVVGPVYEDQLIPIAAALKDKGVPVVSPLARLKHITSDVVFQMSPSTNTRHLKIKELQDSTVRVVFITNDKSEKRFENEMREMLKGVPHIINHKFAYEHPAVAQKYAAERAQKGVVAPGDLKPYLRGNRPTVLVVTVGTEFDISQVFESLNKAKRELAARKEPLAPHVIIGSTKWNSLKNIERDMMFAHTIVQLSTYHTRRSEPIIRRFDSRFVREFGMLPTRYAYRGYDAAMIFVKELYNSIDTGLNGVEFKPLLTSYKFETDSVSGVRVNTEWMKIVYNPNYTITNE